MVPDRQKVRTDGRTDGMDGQTMPKLYPSDFIGGYSDAMHHVAPHLGLPCLPSFSASEIFGNKTPDYIQKGQYITKLLT